MRRYYSGICFLLIAVFLGCDYMPAPQILPEHIRKITVQDFFDETGRLVVSQKLTREVISGFWDDRRLAVVSYENADAILIGRVSKYILSPLSFDENYVPYEYKLWIWVDLSLKDKATDKILWVEKRMAAELKYFAAPQKGENFYTEEEAQDIIIKSLAKDIVKRTIDGWVSASGISEKK